MGYAELRPARSQQGALDVGAIEFWGTPIRQHLQAQLDQALPKYLSRYRTQLREWFRRSLAVLREGFTVRAGIYRAQLEQPVSSPAAEPSAANLETDLKALQNSTL